MELCSDGHDEVCYDSNKYCPVCAMKDDYEDQIDTLNGEIDELNNEIDDLKNTITEWESK